MRKRSWNEPLTPSGSRKSSMRRPPASIPSWSVSTTASRSSAACLRVMRSARRQRVDLRAEQRLVGVDVADAGDPLLVEQHRLDRGAGLRRKRVQVLAGELGLERLDAEPLAEEVVERLAAERELAGAEPPRVDELQLVGAEVERDARVRGAALGRVEQQRAGHPQVQHQVRLVLELPHEVLAAAAEPLDAAAVERRRELLRGERERAAGVVDLELAQRAAVDVRRQVAADGLDLGQLGHRF